MRMIAAPGLLVLLAACGQSDSDPGPGGVTVGEARALDEAAAMLEEQRRVSPEEARVLEGAQEAEGANTEAAAE